MEIITYDLLLNTRYSGCRQQIQLYKGEVNARRFRIELCHGTEPIVLDPLTCTAIIRGVKADKTVLFNTATVTEKGKVEYTLGSQDTAAVGETWYEVQIICKDDSDTKGRLLYSAQFKTIVNNTAVDDGKITSSSEFGLLTETIEENKQWLSYTNKYIVNLEKSLKANIENWEETTNENLNNTIKEGLWLTKVSFDEENKLVPVWNRGSIDPYTHSEVENPGLFLSDYLKGGTNIRFYKFDLGLGTPGNDTNFVIYMYDEEKSYIGKKYFSNNPPIDENIGYYEEPFWDDDGKLVSCAYIRLQFGKLYDENYDINSRLEVSSVKYSRENIYIKNIVSEMMDKMHDHANKELLDEIKIATSSDVWQGTNALVPMYLLEAMLGDSEIMQRLDRATNQEYGIMRFAGGAETALGEENLAVTPYELKYLLTEMGLWADEQMSDESKGIVQNKVIKQYVDNAVDEFSNRTIAGLSLNNNISAYDLGKKILASNIDYEFYSKVYDTFPTLKNTELFKSAVNNICKSKATVFHLEGNNRPTAQLEDYPGAKQGDLCINKNYKAWICLYAEAGGIVWSELPTALGSYLWDTFYSKVQVDNKLEEKADKNEWELFNTYQADGENSGFEITPALGMKAKEIMVIGYGLTFSSGVNMNLGFRTSANPYTPGHKQLVFANSFRANLSYQIRGLIKRVGIDKILVSLELWRSDSVSTVNVAKRQVIFKDAELFAGKNIVYLCDTVSGGNKINTGTIETYVRGRY